MQYVKIRLIISLLVCLVLLIGCEQASPILSSASSVMNSPSSVTNPVSAVMNSTVREGAIAFDSVTLNGYACDNDVFADYTLTMINIWATWCGPCVREIPDLQKVYEQLPEDVNLMGICLDGTKEPDLARQMLLGSNVQYENIVANPEMMRGFLAKIESIPTTIFVDSDGMPIGEPLVGAPARNVAAYYLQKVDAYLNLIAE